MRIRFPVAALVLVLSVCACDHLSIYDMATTSGPKEPGDPTDPPYEDVLFAKHIGGDWNVYLADISVSEGAPIPIQIDAIVPLTAATEINMSPCWSPARDQIVYRSNKGGSGEKLYRMDSDGGNESMVSANLPGVSDQVASWSPDGNTIVYHSNESGNWDIWIVPSNATGGAGRVNLTNNAANCFAPDWNHDGSRIVYQSDQFGGMQICVMNADGSGQAQLTTGGTNKRAPRFSSDGSRIAYAKLDGPDWQLYVMDSTGGNDRQITHFSNGGFSVQVDSMDWSPDDRYMVFASDHENADGFFQLYGLVPEPGTELGEYAVGEPSGPRVFRLTTDPGERQTEVRW